MDKEEMRKLKGEKWLARSESMVVAGESMRKGGNALIGCGCLLTLLVTIPIIIILFFIL